MNANDGKTYVVLEEKAEPIHKEIREAMNDLEEIVFEDIPEENNEVFNQMILKMIQNMSKIV